MRSISNTPDEYLVEITNPQTLPFTIDHVDHSHALYRTHEQLVGHENMFRDFMCQLRQFQEQANTDHHTPAFVKQLSIYEQMIDQLTQQLADQREATLKLGQQALHFEQAFKHVTLQVQTKDAYIRALLNGRVLRILNTFQTFFNKIKKRTVQETTAKQPELHLEITTAAKVKGWIYPYDREYSNFSITLSVDLQVVASKIVTLNVKQANTQKASFCFELPDTCKDGQPHVISIDIDNTNVKRELVVTLHSINAQTHTPPRKLPDSQLQQRLARFLNDHTTLKFLVNPNPAISIILRINNNVEQLLACLSALYSAESIPAYEIIGLVSVSSADHEQLFAKIHGVRFEYSHTYNNKALINNIVKQANGIFVLFLDDCNTVTPQAIKNAVQTIQSADDIGAVGGKLLLSKDKLRSAGGIIWNDGSWTDYGRGDLPDAPMYAFRRDVDWVGMDFLLTRRALFLGQEGFNQQFYPHTQAIDYCFRLWQNGWRVVYEPQAIVFTAMTETSPKHDQESFYKMHARLLSQRYAPRFDTILYARSRQSAQRRILILDDRIPHSYLGSGYPRAHSFIHALVELNSNVTLYPTIAYNEPWTTVYNDVDPAIEVMQGCGQHALADFLRDRKDYYDVIIISRPRNMHLLRSIMKHHPNWFSQTQIIYDAEALFSLREIAQQRLHGAIISETTIQTMIHDEVQLAEGAHSIVCVADVEADYFRQVGFSDVHVIGHTVIASPTATTFEQRHSVLTMGAVLSEESPNADGLRWFIHDIFPKIQIHIPEIQFISVGINNVASIQQQATEQIILTGKIDDVLPYYEQARIFIAPTRFAAGIPMKVHHAAAHGVPIVTTSLIATQLGWHHDVEVLVADTAEDFAKQCVRLYTDKTLWERLRTQALRKIIEECSPHVFRKKIQQLLVH